MDDIIFYKLANKAEQKAQCAKNKAYNKMPDINGYIKVYMPYGKNGKGFYYQKIL